MWAFRHFALAKGNCAYIKKCGKGQQKKKEAGNDVLRH
jgi:hypothetical protein